MTTFLMSIFLTSNAQSWTAGTGKLYSNPTTTKIGIGISAPAELLHINSGSLKIGNGSDATSRAQNLLKFGDGEFVRIGEWEADDVLSFKAKNFNFTGGNVGIGYTSPTDKLSVDGSIFSKKLTIDHSATADYSYALYLKVHRDLTKAFCILNGNGAVFTIWGNGIVNAKKIYAEAFEVTPDAGSISWYDHVFAPEFELKPLAEVEEFIKVNRHLS